MAVLGWLPLSVSRAMGAGIARIGWWFSPRPVKVTCRNIDLCYPHLSAAERRHLAHASVVESGRLSFEINTVWQRDIPWLMSRIVAVHGESLVTGPASGGRGVMLLSPHIGNWEVMGIHCSSLGPMGILYQPPKQAYLEPLMRRARARMGATQLTTDVRGVAGLFKTLRKGEMIGILPDQVPEDAGGEFADFFGQPALTMTLVHKLVQKTGCQVVMCYALRRPGGFEVYYQAPPEDIYSSNEATSLRGLNRAVEDVVAACPEQYQWEYKRFRKVPPGAERHYRFK